MKCISSNIKEIKIIDLNEEYPGLTSNVRWAVVSDMNYQELSNEFGEELKPFTPFLILTEEQGEEIIRYNRNQEKFDWRMRNKEDFIGYEDGRTESVHKVRCGENLISSIELKDEYSALYSALDDLTDKQRERIILNYINGLSERKIAALQGVCQKSVHESIASGLKKLEKSEKLKTFLKNTPSKAYSHS